MRPIFYGQNVFGTFDEHGPFGFNSHRTSVQLGKLACLCCFFPATPSLKVGVNGAGRISVVVMYVLCLSTTLLMQRWGGKDFVYTVAQLCSVNSFFVS